MSYLVLARKYRPTTFADIIGQEHVVRTLQNAIKLGRVHHAFLFTGARGVGKTTTARVLARALNCEHGPTPDPCGKCSACTQMATAASADVLEIDGASNTGVDSIRELRETVRYLPSHGRFKLYIIDEVHMLSTAAFNALLKTLEEPPPHVKFIFATTEPHKIPVTILSRCQRFDFRRVSMAQLTQHLKSVLDRENVKLSPSAIVSIVREAQGSVRDALSLLDQVLSFGGDQPDDGQVASALGMVERETIFQLADALLAKDAQRLLALIAEVDARGHDLTDVATLLVEHCRDLLVVKIAEPTADTLDRSPGEISALAAAAEKISRADIHRLFTGLVCVAEDVSRSTFARITLEMGLLRLFEIEPVTSLGELMTRLDALAGASPNATTQRSSAPTSTTAHPAIPPTTAKAASAASPKVATETAQPKTLPCTPASSPAICTDPPPSSSGGADMAWARLVERVRPTKPSVASLLEHAHVLRFSPEGVQLGFVANTFYWETARDADVRAIIAHALAEQFGQEVELKVVPFDAATSQAPATLAAVQDENERRRDQEIKATAIAHPAVRETIAVLGGEITNVVTLPNNNARR